MVPLLLTTAVPGGSVLIKITVLLAVPPCHRPVACRIHGIGAIKDGVEICCILSGDYVRVKGAGRWRERDETDETERDGLFIIGAPRAEEPAFAVINVVSRHVADAK